MNLTTARDWSADLLRQLDDDSLRAAAGCSTVDSDEPT
jgi:hypothetical protein